MTAKQDDAKPAKKQQKPAAAAESQTAEATAEAAEAPAEAVPAKEAQPDSAPADAALEAAQAEAERYKDLALRAEAELQNVKKRAAQDLEKARKYGLERFLQNLLPVVDSIEKAIDALDEAKAEPALAEGVRLCHKLFIDILARDGVEAIEPLGEPFDPELHQAMSMVDKPDMEPGSVFQVVQKGYTLNGRLVRAAMVMVTRGAEENGGEGAG